jgi:hypothetical protein
VTAKPTLLALHLVSILDWCEIPVITALIADYTVAAISEDVTPFDDADEEKTTLSVASPARRLSNVAMLFDRR